MHTHSTLEYSHLASPGSQPRRAVNLARECPGCRALAYSDDRYCACCGTQLAHACGACGSPIVHPVANYCSQCGVAVTTRSGD
jgi:hypothetical protein